MKRYSLASLLRTDFRRAVALSRLKLRHRDELGENNSSVPTGYIVSIPLAGLGTAAPSCSGVVPRVAPVLTAGGRPARGAIVILLNREFLRRHPAQRRWAQGAGRPCRLLWLELLVAGVGARLRPPEVPLRKSLLRAMKGEPMGYSDYVRHGLKVVRKKGQLPVYLVYFISDICNAKCKHCLLADGAHPELGEAHR